MFAFFLTPIGRYVGAAIIVVLVLTGVYYKISTDAVNAYINKENTQSLDKVDEAVKAGDAIDSVDANPARLRDPDSFERK